jgi:Na+/melibiose symporter-like transporter
MAADPAGQVPIKTSEFFFKTTGTLIVLIIVIALIRLLIPEPGHAWGIFRPIGGLIFMSAGAGLIFAIWEN